MTPLDENRALASLGVVIAGTSFYNDTSPPLSPAEARRFGAVATLILGAVVAAMLDNLTPLAMAAGLVVIMETLHRHAGRRS